MEKFKKALHEVVDNYDFYVDFNEDNNIPFVCGITGVEGI